MLDLTFKDVVKNNTIQLNQCMSWQNLNPLVIDSLSIRKSS